VRFGFHISIAGGFSNVIERATRLGCETAQIFTGSNKQWKRTPLDPDVVAGFRASLKEAQLHPLTVHLFYLPNLATPDEELLERSRQALSAELERSSILGADFLVLHPGAYKNSSPDKGISRVSQSLNRAILAADEEKVKILVENTSGGGTRLGGSFDDLARIIDGVDKKDSVGICFDTAHAFQAGYPLHTSKGLEDTLARIDHLIGLDKLLLMHLNDSKTHLGSHNDRHWHIGEGEIGIEVFRRIINHPKLKHLPAIMETPSMPDADNRNMATVKRLREEG
jgi:deoxyribonuclease-4